MDATTTQGTDQMGGKLSRGINIKPARISKKRVSISCVFTYTEIVEAASVEQVPYGMYTFIVQFFK